MESKRLTGKNAEEEHIMAVSTTKMSSKGQVVIPESIRESLGLQTGARFVVVAGQDAILLKLVTQPSMEEFDELLAEARRQARRTGLKQSDIGNAIAAVRRER